MVLLLREHTLCTKYELNINYSESILQSSVSHDPLLKKLFLSMLKKCVLLNMFVETTMN